MPRVGGSVFTRMFRKASLDCDIPEGPEKRAERERQGVREHHVYRTQEWPSGQKALLWHTVKEA